VLRLVVPEVKMCSVWSFLKETCAPFGRIEIFHWALKAHFNVEEPRLRETIQAICALVTSLCNVGLLPSLICCCRLNALSCMREATIKASAPTTLGCRKNIPIQLKSDLTELLKHLANKPPNIPYVYFFGNRQGHYNRTAPPELPLSELVTKVATNLEPIPKVAMGGATQAKRYCRESWHAKHPSTIPPSDRSDRDRN
jgi:hypothetical protein